MTIDDSGRVQQLSVTQLVTFDHAQQGGCHRKFWFERKHDLRDTEEKRDSKEGIAGHALLAAYFSTGALPAKRTLMGKAVTGAILKGELPKPGPDLLVEERLDGQPMRTPAGEYIPLDVENTLVIAGVPFDGSIDLAYRRSARPVIMDHKFAAATRVTPLGELTLRQYAVKSVNILKTIQLPTYAISQRPYWPDAREWELTLHYVSKKGIDSFFRTQVVTVEQLDRRRTELELLVEKVKSVAATESQEDVPANLRSCREWNGCPYQNICSAFKRRSKMAMLTEEDDDFFDGLESEIKSESAPPPPPPAPPEAPKRRMLIVDAPAEPGQPPEPSKPVEEPAPVCQCGEQVTKDNGSRLQNGTWKHVGCKLDAPPAPPAAPKQRRAKSPPAPPEAPKTSEPSTPPSSTTTSVASVEIISLSKREHAVADVLESIARLLRTA